ncbi:MAG TPA: NADH-ubiquinone oxidoreductase-F iron-sulfur binding region domain-containing protein [Mycobacteriales bacterium]|jgi:NADH:ubiquinone oxidoreductase subunit F (NADH-binding)|nr:NADH-ubiquinone oxidoreductase-F iron-sulfur binding region domain-containing protein [Mycobacteriales bacterium]
MTAGLAVGPRLLDPAAGAADLQAHLARPGPLPTGPELLAAVAAAGLSGRGGAAFPTHRKLATVAAARGRKVVVGNGAEGEPASGKDRALLRAAPHLVLDGLQLAARIVGAHQIYLYVHRDAGPAQAAVAARAGLGELPVEIVLAPHRFLAGEESALAAHLSGEPGLPRDTPPRVYERGVRGRPTLVQNVETLAHLALICRYGPDWFRRLGTVDEPGSMLLTVTDPAGRARVLEAPIGVRIGDLPGLDPVPAAVLVGGYHGSWLPGRVALDLPLSNAALRPYGASRGAGVVVALGADRCGVVESARVAGYLARQSAGQCGPCLNGLPAIAAAFTELARGRHPELRARIERWAGLVEGRGACHHPDGTVRFVRSALRVFAAELDLHAAGRCTATDRRPLLPVGEAGE